jgi:putative spermidine/putrescine transport system permease protein
VIRRHGVVRRSAPAVAEALLLALLLAVLLWPLAYATWISFTPSSLLEPPRGLELSLRWYSAFWASPRWTAGLRNSLVVAGASVLLSLSAGIGLALALAGRRLRGIEIGARIVMLPLFVPPVVLGMALLPFVRLLGLWGSSLSIAAAHSLLSLPIVYLVVRNALDAADPDLARAARGLGATRLLAFRRVVLPLIAPAIVLGTLMAFVLSLNEFVIALFLATPATETLPKVIWPNLRYTLTPLTAAASAITVGITLAGMVIVLILRIWTRRIGSRDSAALR